MTTIPVTTNFDSGAGSLRAAILTSNSDVSLEPNVITFDISPGGQQTITLTSGALPAIDQSVLIEGDTQPGYNNTTHQPLIEIDGSSVPNVNGITLDANSSGSGIEGLSIVNFMQSSPGPKYAAIDIETGSNGDLIQGNYLGVETDGSTPGPNDYGIAVYSAGTTIGGTTAGAGNLIAHNNSEGIDLYQAQGATIEGNTIDSNGSSGIFGYELTGGDVTIANNTISGNASNGIYVEGFSVDLSIHGNTVANNGDHGISLSGSIAGIPYQASITDNTINHNGYTFGADGIFIFGGSFSLVVAGNDIENNDDDAMDIFYVSHVTIGGTALGAGNIIAGNTDYGIDVRGASNAYAQDILIEGNTVGIDKAGDPSANASYGIYGEYLDGITIGGTTSGSVNAASNVIAYNGYQGIELDHVNGPEILGNSIYENSGSGIELSSVSGTGAKIGDNAITSNEYGGIYVHYSTVDIAIFDNDIEENGTSGVAIVAGSTTSAHVPKDVFNADITGNTIDGNGQDFPGGDGIYVSGGVVTVTILGNEIGGNYDGYFDPGDGIQIDGESHITIGGPTLADRNVIIDNGGGGIVIEGTVAQYSTGDLIENNDIGVSLNNDSGGNYGAGIWVEYTSGLSIFGNKVEDTTYDAGIDIYSSASPTIGGTAAWDANIIANNEYGGIYLENVSGPEVIGNRIADNGRGAEYNNSTAYGGIYAQSLSSLPAVFSGNVIFDNYGAGIYVNNSVVNLTIQGNDISSNAGGGISIRTSSGTSTAISVAIDGNLIVANEYDGIYVSGGIVTLSIASNTVDNNFGDGIGIVGESNATIGGSTPSAGNVIAGNQGDGIYLAGVDVSPPVIVGVQPNSLDEYSTDDLIWNNYVGVAGANCQFGPGVTGRTGNLADGIELYLTDVVGIYGNTIAENTDAGVYATQSDGLTVGWNFVDGGNVIADNGTDGIALNQVDSFSIVGNFIGYNGSNGVSDRSDASYGGFYANTISGNTNSGIYVLDSTGYLDIYLNEISCNGGDGIALDHVRGYDIYGNVVNSNSASGIFAQSATSYGGFFANTISGNANAGIWLLDSTGDVVIVENDISSNGSSGVAASYTVAPGAVVPNSPSNLWIGIYGNNIGGNSSDGIYIGGGVVTTEIVSNNISDNAGDGVDVRYESNATIDGNNIWANSLSGILIEGTALIASTGDQIEGNTIGGSSVSSGNAGAGIVAIDTGGLKIEGDTIENNHGSGIDVSYCASTAANISGNTIEQNGGDGIFVAAGTVEVSIGGSSSGMGNTISGNTGDGILFGSSTLGSGAIVQNNEIISNGGAGVLINSPNNTIGGTGAYESNLISDNTGAGIAIGFDAAVTGNLFSGNSIFGNGALGIDLNSTGVPLPNNSDIPNNNGQNYPVFTAVTENAGNTTATVTGTLDGASDTTYTIEFFTNTTADPSGYGQGQVFLDSTTVTTDAMGHATIDVVLSGVTTGTIISATATDPNHNTSEFSKDATALPATTTAVSSSSLDTTYGQNVTFTASVGFVAPGSTTPTGTVEFYNFYDGLNHYIGSAPLVSGEAIFRTTALSVGSHSITAVYEGDGNNNPSTSAPIIQSVAQATTTTTVTSSPSGSSVFGQDVTFTATVSVVLPGAGVVTGGSVEFYDATSGTTVDLGAGTLGDGVWTYTTSTLSVGMHDQIYAAYTSENPGINSSTSADFTQAVGQATTTTTVTSSPSGSSVFGQDVTFTATVSVVSPGAGDVSGGSVEFYDGTGGTTVDLGAGTFGDGVWTYTTSTLSVGTHDQIYAVYTSVDPGINSSTSPYFTQAVSQASTTTVVTSSLDSSVSGQDVTFTATVSVVGVMPSDIIQPNFVPATPLTGNVEFYNGAVDLGPGTPDGEGVWTLTTSALAVGSNPNVTAVYSGDPNFANSTAPDVAQPVNPASSQATLTISPNPSVAGQPVTFTATLVTLAPGSGTPTGTVTFLNGSTVLGTEPLVNGVATLTIASLPAGTNSISISYNGSTNNEVSSSASQSQTNQIPTTPSVVPSVTAAAVGTPITLTTTIASSGGAGAPTGTVTFMDGATVLGTAPVNSNGVATLTVPSLPAGTSIITATYSGDALYAPSVSQVATVAVAEAINGPQVTGVQRYGFHAQGSSVYITFNGPIDPTYAEDLGNYSLVGPITGHGGGKAVRIGSAVYNADTNSVTLTIAQTWNVHWKWTLTVIGAAPGGLRNTAGVMLDGASNGLSGSNYVTTITLKNLAGRHSDVPKVVKHHGHSAARPKH